MVFDQVAVCFEEHAVNRAHMEMISRHNVWLHCIPVGLYGFCVLCFSTSDPIVFSLDLTEGFLWQYWLVSIQRSYYLYTFYSSLVREIISLLLLLLQPQWMTLRAIGLWDWFLAFLCDLLMSTMCYCCFSPGLASSGSYHPQTCI